jgi:hypothetical protein
MSRVTLDSDLRSKLNGLNEQVEVCDESGRTVGHFLPAKEYDRLIYKILAVEFPFSEEDLRRLREDPSPGRPLAEIWKSLGRTDV